MLNQSFPTTCVLEQPQQKLNSPCWVFTNPWPLVGGQCIPPTPKSFFLQMCLKEGKYAGVGKIRISPQVLEDAWLFNNNRSVTVLLCNYQSKGWRFFCLLKQHSSSVGL